MFAKKSQTRSDAGFTLLELLIVISIIAILSVMLIIVINPAETLMKSRDSQRIADLNALKTAIGVYMVSTSTPVLARAAANNDECKVGAGGGNYTNLLVMRIRYSWPSNGKGLPITDKTLDSVTFTYVNGANQVTTANLTNVDATGWMQVKFSTLTGGSPISALPIDPVNVIALPASVQNTDLVYRYACNSTSMTYELDAHLESAQFTVTNDKQGSDGGNNASMYEVGTNLKILGPGGGAAAQF